MLTVALALGTSLCYGVANFLGPLLSRRDTLVAVFIVSQLAALAGCLLYLAVDRGPFLDGGPLLVALLAGGANAGGILGFYKAAEFGPLSVVAPIGATAVAVPVAWGLAHGDELTALQGAGLVLAAGGCVVAARKPVPTEGMELDLRRCLGWIGVSVIGFGIFLVALPEAAEHGRAWALVDARIALLAVAAAWAGSRLRDIRLSTETKWQLTPGILLVTGTLMYAAAASRDHLSLVAVLSTLFPVVIVALGVVVLGERPTRMQALGVATALVGVIFLAA